MILWPLYHYFSKCPANTLCIYICTVQKRLSACYAYIHAQCKKGFQLVMHIYMHTFHYFMVSRDYCKFYVIFRWNGFFRPLGVGEVVNGVRGSHSHETRSKQRWQPNATSVDRYYWLSFTCCNHLSLFEKHMSEDDEMFTLRVEGFFQIVHIYMHKVVKGLSKKSFENFL